MSKYKVKTSKSIAKRFWKTGSGKIRRRTAGQDHFNARDKGKATRNKRSDQDLHPTNVAFKKKLPYL